MRNSGLQGDFLLAGQIGTIPILRHQKVWVGGFAKWQFLKMFSTIFIIYAADIVGQKKIKNMLT